MSDYSDYSDYEDFSDQDHYARSFGGHDDLYDDVVEEAGYDAWNIEQLEFGFDEERYLFELDPFSEYFDLLNSSQHCCTYQGLVCFQNAKTNHQNLKKIITCRSRTGWPGDCGTLFT